MIRVKGLPDGTLYLYNGKPATKVHNAKLIIKTIIIKLVLHPYFCSIETITLVAKSPPMHIQKKYQLK
jgi:hypothetical protein